MRNIENRLKRLEGGRTDDHQGTLDLLALMHKIEHGPPSAETMKELEGQARELAAQGVFFSIAELLRKIDGKGLFQSGDRPEERYEGLQTTG